MGQRIMEALYEGVESSMIDFDIRPLGLAIEHTLPSFPKGAAHSSLKKALMHKDSIYKAARIVIGGVDEPHRFQDILDSISNGMQEVDKAKQQYFLAGMVRSVSPEYYSGCLLKKKIVAVWPQVEDHCRVQKIHAQKVRQLLHVFNSCSQISSKG